MAIGPQKVWELVDSAVNHRWSVPEFQRGFVWKSTQVRDLAESLWLDFPVGSLLLWNSHGAQKVRSVKDGVQPELWIVDGQQRTTALCLLFGRRPYWWDDNEDWNSKLKRYDIRFDIAAKEEPYFLVANAVTRKAKGDRYIPISRLLALDTSKAADQKKLGELAESIKYQGLCDGMNGMEVYTRLDRICKIREKDVFTVTVNHDLEDVVEIFSRLNSKGTRVTEADIYLGVVASKNRGWVRDHFLPFLKILAMSGFHVDPNLLFRTLTAVGIQRVRFRDVKEEFWTKDQIVPAWDRCKYAWKKVVQHLSRYGVSADDLLPTQAALVTLVSLQDRFQETLNFDYAFYWFVQASRFGRYSGSGATALEEDLRTISEAKTGKDAVIGLVKRFNAEVKLEPTDFDRDYTDGKFGRFLLYLLVYRNEAQDWEVNGSRLGFDGSELLQDFTPQWHHIFPKKFLEGKVPAEWVDSLANIAVIGPQINIRISAQDPMTYLDRYEISDLKLQQQFIFTDRSNLTTTNFEKFLDDRAVILAAKANEFLTSLSEGLSTAKPETISSLVSVGHDA